MKLPEFEKRDRELFKILMEKAVADNFCKGCKYLDRIKRILKSGRDVKFKK